jgi:hypothetical protein
MTGTEPIFTKLALFRHFFVRNFYTVFHEHAKSGLPAAGRSFAVGPMDSRYGLHTHFFFFKNAYNNTSGYLPLRKHVVFPAACEFRTLVSIRIQVFRDVTPLRLVSSHRRFGEA